jgi:type IV secretion system protein VirB11
MQARDSGDETRIRELEKLRTDRDPLVLAALEDPRTIEVVLNPDGQLWQEKLDELMQEISRMEAWQAEALIRTMVMILRIVGTRENPIIGGELPDGSRFASQLPPIATAPCFAIEKRASEVCTLEQYADAGIRTPAEVAVVRQAVRPARFSRLSFRIRFLIENVRPGLWSWPFASAFTSRGGFVLPTSRGGPSGRYPWGLVSFCRAHL